MTNVNEGSRPAPEDLRGSPGGLGGSTPDASSNGDLAYVEPPAYRAYIDRTDADDAQFADELARLNRLDVADESAVERVARALWADDVRVYGNTVAMPSWESGEPDLTDDFRRLARAAIAALKPAPGTDTSTEDALHRVLDLADELERSAAEASRLRTLAARAIALAEDSAAERIRAAVADPRRDHRERP